MGNVSRPLLGLLVATVAFFALWIVALKPNSSSTTGSPSSHGLRAYQPAIDRAKGTQAVVDRGAAAATGTLATTAPIPTHAPASVRKPSAQAKPKVASAGHAAPAAVSSAAPARRLGVVERALAAHKVLAALFYNPAASDDRAVAQELASVPVHRGQGVKLAVPLSELSSYAAITNQVPVAFSPTLVVINRSGKASEIVGFADTFEIAQRIAGAM